MSSNQIRVPSPLTQSYTAPGNGRIVGGSTAVSNQVPYIASLRWIRDNNLHFCGGSIIRPAWILTAAHCVTGVLDDEITVVVGSTRLSSGGYAHRSSRIISHPDYDEDSLCADVAVVQVSQSFVYNDAVQPIFLSNVEITEAHALVSGWGMLNVRDHPRCHSSPTPNPIVHCSTHMTTCLCRMSCKFSTHGLSLTKSAAMDIQCMATTFSRAKSAP